MNVFLWFPDSPVAYWPKTRIPACWPGFFMFVSDLIFLTKASRPTFKKVVIKKGKKTGICFGNHLL
jgi:hypothetical protein